MLEYFEGEYVAKKMFIDTGVIVKERVVKMWSGDAKVMLEGDMRPVPEMEKWFGELPFRGEGKVPRAWRVVGVWGVLKELPGAVKLGAGLVWDGDVDGVVNMGCDGDGGVVVGSCSLFHVVGCLCVLLSSRCILYGGWPYLRPSKGI